MRSRSRRAGCAPRTRAPASAAPRTRTPGRRARTEPRRARTRSSSPDLPLWNLARPSRAAGRDPMPSRRKARAALAVASDYEKAEHFPGHGLAFWMADEAGDPQVGTQTGEPTHPAIRLRGNPVGSDQRLEAIARHDKLTRDHPVGA